MNTYEKKHWRIAAVTGAVFMAICCVISVFQFFDEKRYAEFVLVRYDSLIINFTAFFCFIILIFKPLHFNLYAFMFYIYGLGNLLDFGNLLGCLCLITSALFLFFSDFFKTKILAKIILFVIPPVIMICLDIKPYGFVKVLVNCFQMLGACVIAGFIVLLFWPKFKEIKTYKAVKYVNPAKCTEEELNWLKMVLKGEKYITIAKSANVSESKIKARMLELYRMLGSYDRTEFVAMYRNCNLEFEKK